MTEIERARDDDDDDDDNDDEASPKDGNIQPSEHCIFTYGPIDSPRKVVMFSLKARRTYRSGAILRLALE